jgi:hypothetical protein
VIGAIVGGSSSRVAPTDSAPSWSSSAEVHYEQMYAGLIWSSLLSISVFVFFTLARQPALQPLARVRPAHQVSDPSPSPYPTDD